MSIKKPIETWIKDLFIDLYKNGSLTVLSEQESPDYILDLAGKKIGLEITEIFQDSHLKHSKLQQQSSDGELFTEELITLLSPHIDFFFSIGIDFNKAYPIKKSSRHNTLLKTKEICIKRMATLLNHEHLELDSYYDQLPEEIQGIHIYRFDEMEESINSKPEGGTVARLTLAHLNPILEKKEKKLPSYSSCEEQWLLIREGNYYAGSFSTLDIDIPIDSLFTKVFLLRTRSKELIELK